MTYWQPKTSYVKSISQYWTSTKDGDNTATVTYIPEHTQSKTAMSRVINYVLQNKKTLYEQDGQKYKLISGKDCCPELAFQEFMATKKQYGKVVGMFFYQYVQSFDPNENITPEKAHEVGIELANYFKDHEVLIASHLDSGVIHNHFIINSVSHVTGLKLQEGPDSLLKMRKLSDEICLQHGLSILKPYTYEKDKVKGMNTREYRSAEKGDSWKFKLMNTIDKAMQNSHSKEEFIDTMAVNGYQTNWVDNRKHITYTTPDNKKCRDSKLHKEKYLKKEMEVFFNESRFTAVKGIEQSRRNNASGGNTPQTIYVDNLRNTTGAMGSDNNPTDRAGKSQFRDTETHNRVADMGGFNKQPESIIVQDEQRTLQSCDGQRKEHKVLHGGNEKINEEGTGSNNEGNRIRNAIDITKIATNPTSKGFIANKPTTEVDGNRSVDTNTIMDAANVLESLIKPTKSKKNYKEIENNERRRKQQQELLEHQKEVKEYNDYKQDFEDDNDYDFDMHM